MATDIDEMNQEDRNPDERNQRLVEELSELERHVDGRCDNDASSNSLPVSEFGPRVPPAITAAERAAAISRGVRPRREHEEDWAFFREALPDYDVKERIHYGGQGVVYRAFHRVAKRTVAIKVLLDGPLASQRQRQRLTREMELVARLRHPNIVTLYEAGEVRGRPFLVMEYVDGLPIDDYVLVNDLSVRQIVETFRKVCYGVGSAHERGVIHRDLKPANILVDANGKPSVLDFGLARDTGASEDSGASPVISLTGQIVGTLPYLSPEQAGGKNRDVDIRTDIYALGVVLFELITQTYPYPIDGSPEEVRATIISREPMRLGKTLAKNSSDRPGAHREVNDDLERIVLKALSKEKERRYHSAASLADDLNRYLAGEAVEAKAASSFYVLRKSLRRFRLQMLAGLCGLAVLVGAGVWVGAERVRTQTISELYKGGLRMGGLVRLGSVHADEGRFDQAIAMLQSVVEIGKTLSQHDRVVVRYLHDAYLQLTNLYITMGDLEKADHYTQLATALSNEILAEKPNDPEWVRLKGFTDYAQARVALERGDWSAAMAATEQGVQIRSGLLEREPDNLSLKSELADFLGFKGKCLRRRKRFEEAHAVISEAYKLYEDIAHSDPDAVDPVIELARTETRLAILRMTRKNDEDDKAAAEWFDTAEARLTSLQASGRSAIRNRDINQMLEVISQNRAIMQRNAVIRSKAAD